MFGKKNEIQAVMDRLEATVMDRLEAMEARMTKDIRSVRDELEALRAETRVLKDDVQMMKLRERGATISNAFGGSIHSPSLEFGVKSNWSPRKSARFRGIF